MSLRCTVFTCGIEIMMPTSKGEEYQVRWWKPLMSCISPSVTSLLMKRPRAREALWPAQGPQLTWNLTHIKKSARHWLPRGPLSTPAFQGGGARPLWQPRLAAEACWQPPPTKCSGGGGWILHRFECCCLYLPVHSTRYPLSPGKMSIREWEKWRTALSTCLEGWCLLFTPRQKWGWGGISSADWYSGGAILGRDLRAYFLYIYFI